jgi:hypothetical protein
MHAFHLYNRLLDIAISSDNDQEMFIEWTNKNSNELNTVNDLGNVVFQGFVWYLIFSVYSKFFIFLIGK